MRAVVVTQHGGPGVLRVEERPPPAVPVGHVRIRVHAAGVNFADVMARSGLYPDAPKPPCILGFELAGVVERLGSGVEHLAIGQSVIAATRFGGHAELVSVPGGQALPLPDGFDFEHAAALPVNYVTAYAALVLMAGLRSGERLLLHGAGGGVGIAAAQLARWIGADVYGTASAYKHAALRAQGIQHLVDPRRCDFERAILRLTDGEGVDVAIDATGPASFRKDYRLLRQGGRLVVLGLAEVQRSDVARLLVIARDLALMPFATFPWWKGPQILKENKGVFGLNVLSWWDREGNLDRLAQPILRLASAGALAPVVAARFPFEAAADAHRFLQQRRNIGKVVLIP